MPVLPLNLQYKNKVKQRSTQEDVCSAWQGLRNMAAVNMTQENKGDQLDRDIGGRNLRYRWEMFLGSRVPLILGQSTNCVNIPPSSPSMQKWSASWAKGPHRLACVTNAHINVQSQMTHNITDITVTRLWTWQMLVSSHRCSARGKLW